MDLLGRPTDYDQFLPVAHACRSLCWSHSGATHRHDRPAGTMGRAGVYSFSGNRIRPTSGGGMLVSDDGGTWWRRPLLVDPVP